jgi:hypothetical protein
MEISRISHLPALESHIKMPNKQGRKKLCSPLDALTKSNTIITSSDSALEKPTPFMDLNLFF